jgi:rod shape-determining protein MreD
MKWYLGIFLFFLFLIQGSVLQWLLPQAWGSTFVIVPQLVLNGIVAMALYLEEQEVLLFGFGFGLLHDIVYGPAIGIGALSMTVAAWGSSLVAREFPPLEWLFGLAAFLVQSGYFLMVYGWFLLFDFTSVPFPEALFLQILPSVLFNALLGYPVYKGVALLLRKRRDASIQLFR